MLHSHDTVFMLSMRLSRICLAAIKFSIGYQITIFHAESRLAFYNRFKNRWRNWLLAFMKARTDLTP